ncbi:cadherin repeat domain-containing protein [Aequorivita todarodis]|uniref:cadherin repeat domain-containing protein n=1 Tax=Aequorivita todarodis TaxID=2036821 RepID=UPI00234FB869|nr:cadherin repeat domain-containing protein [Aequorivita todarodis]MDC8000367.1 cadherin repeat domain-containing protein [Aequorivita todarodis]
MRVLRNNRLSILFLFSTLIFVSCSKESDDPNPTEITVSTSDFSKIMDENPPNGQVIGNVQGSTNQGTVIFSITEQNPAGAFSINSASGELKVANEALFDFETNPTITGTVKVANGAVFENASVSISLNDVNEDNIFDGNVVLTTQAEVDEFGTHNYIGITGYLIIGYNFGYDYSNITNLSPLEALTFVHGEIVISNNGELQTLTGLDNLAEIGSSLSIYENPVLNTLVSLSNLNVIHKDLAILYNSSLTTFNGLQNITAVERNLLVQGMPVVTLDGLPNISSIGNLSISFNPNLENIDTLSTLRELSGNLYIQKNPLLSNLDAFQNVNNSIIPQLRILENESLTDLNGLQNIGASDYLEISDNTSLTTLLGLESITNINSQIIIERNNLINLNGLENLIEVAQQFRIWQNPNLTDFCALTNLCVSGNLPSFLTESNAYNPTKQDIINGNCSL